jgi:hypothetical protein
MPATSKMLEWALIRGGLFYFFAALSSTGLSVPVKFFFLPLLTSSAVVPA